MVQVEVAIGVKGEDAVWRTLGTVTLDGDEDYYEGFAQAFEEVAVKIRESARG